MRRFSLTVALAVTVILSAVTASAALLQVDDGTLQVFTLPTHIEVPTPAAPDVLADPEPSPDSTLQGPTASSAVPRPAPEATPTPEPTLEVSPEATPTPEPTPSPEPTLEVTPEPTPTPAPTREATPSPTPDPAPEPTPTG